MSTDICRVSFSFKEKEKTNKNPLNNFWIKPKVNKKISFILLLNSKKKLDKINENHLLFILSGP